MKKLILLCAVALVAMLAVSTPSDLLGTADATADIDSGFVDTDGTQFVLNDEPYFFVGTNFWYGLNLAVNDSTGDRERLERELNNLQSMGITNLRIMAGSEGPNSAPWRMVPALQTAPGIYDPLVLDGLDYLLYAIKERNLRAVMCLTNFWHWSGGMAQYVSWNGGGDIPYPPPETGGDWDTYQDYASDFYSNEGAIDDYQNHIEYLINHVNPYTGLAYKDEPAIVAWELANEPRGFNNAASFNLWIDNTAAFIEALDSNHLMTTGCEGDTPWPAWNGLDFISNHDGPNIDYATVHIWPQNWDWYDPTDPEGTYPLAEANARAYFNDHIARAASLNKPLVLEEFGLARDGGSYDPQAGTIWRDKFFTAMYQAVHNSASSGGPVAGDNFWAWAGEGRPLSPYGSYWSRGDPWIADPPHERQGWYSVYDSDATSLAVISNHVSDMNALSAISYSPPSLSFAATEGGSNPSSQTLGIWNSGGGTLSWSVSDNAAWLNLSPTSGTSTGETDDVIVSVNTSGMAAGSYNTTISISAPGATNTPQTVPVTLTTKPETLHIDANPFLFVYPGPDCDLPDALTNIGPEGLDVVIIVWGTVEGEWVSFHPHTGAGFLRELVNGEPYVMPVTEVCHWWELPQQ